MAGQGECANCKRLQAEVDSLKLRIERLEGELRRVMRQAGRFSREKHKSASKKPGRKKGEGSFNHRQAPPEDEIDTERVSLERCPNCGGPLEGKQSHAHIESDLPLPRPVHRRFVTESGYCPRCNRRYRSRHPGQSSTATGAAGVSLGPNAKALAADMKHRLGIPYAKTADLLSNVFGLPVTPGGLCQADARLARKAKPAYEQLVDAIRQCCAVHADETGWRIGALSAWLWVFTSSSITVYTIRESRGHEVILEILGRKFKGVLHADCFLAYDHRALSDWLQQKCFAHFLKALSKMQREKTRGAARFPRDVAAALRDALALRDEKDALSPLAFTRRRRKIEGRLDALIDATRKFSDPDNRRFAKRLRKQRRHLFTFLTHDGVEATNNRAERGIRPAVIARKIGGCNKTHRGAETHAILSSILVTAKQQGHNTLDYLSSVLTCPGPAPPPLIPKLDSS